MFGDILQPTHLLFILVVALIVLGPKRLPEVGRSLGKTLRDFRGAMSGIQDEFNDATGANPPKQVNTAPPAAATQTPAAMSTVPVATESSPSTAPEAVASAVFGGGSAPVHSPSAPPVPNVAPLSGGVVASSAGPHEPAPDDYAD